MIFSKLKYGKTKHRTLFIVLLMVSILTGCTSKESYITQGYKPVYVYESEKDNIYLSEPVLLSNPGKIYIRKPYLFINEKGRGVHIVNNADPANPQKIGFINIPGNRDIAVKSNVLYADNITDLVAIDISSISSITVLKRIADVYPTHNQTYPDCQDCYFECADTTKGYIVEWVKTELTDPKCKR